MPRPKIEAFWRERIMAIAANETQLGPGPISRILRQDAATAGRTDVPSERTVSRVLKEFRVRTKEDQAPYREFHWPQSMERGDLPWEASGVGLELLRYLHATNVRGDRGAIGRPLISSVRWLWYVTLARPDASFGTRVLWANDLALSAAGIVNFRMEVEGWMIIDEPSHGQLIFGEIVRGPADGGVVELDERAIEIMQGWSVRNPPERAQPAKKRVQFVATPPRGPESLPLDNDLQEMPAGPAHASSVKPTKPKRKAKEGEGRSHEQAR